MATQEKNTKQQILDVAESLIMTRGYSNFSYKDISEAVGIRKASIHHHYPAKEDMGSAFVQRYRERFIEWRNSIEDKTCKEKLEEFIRLYIFLSNNYQNICPVDMLVTEYPVLPEKIRDDIRRLCTDIIKWLATVIDKGKTQEEFKQGIDSDVMSYIVVMCLSGTLKMARIFKESYEVEPIFEQVRQMVFAEN
ncbi:MAG: TetR/AcrR family transcriptional regulator [Desulfobacteraceae bacterium]|nr:TetR/AcrR family transcriptional regulator [Desulfobacteraceae bacterium]